MVVRDTSRESFKVLNKFVNMGDCKKLVYHFILDNPGCSIKDIKDGTGLLQENVCGRKKELEEEGLIKKVGEKLNVETNRSVETWEVCFVGEKIKLKNSLSDSEMKKIKKLVFLANEFQRSKIVDWCNNHKRGSKIEV